MSVSAEPLLLVFDEFDQFGGDCIDGGEGIEFGEGIVVAFEQLEELCGACDEEGFLFIAMDGGLDEDREIPVIVVGGLHGPCRSAGLNGLGDGVGLLGRDAAQGTDGD